MTLSLRDVVIESVRLRLVPTSDEYAQAIFETFTPTVTTYMYPKSPTVINETLAFLRDAVASLEDGVQFQLAIEHAETREFLGHTGLHEIRSRQPELGIWIKESAHGHHYGREAVTALAGWALENLDFDYLKYPVDRRNVASRKIPESLGGRVEAEYEITSASGTLLDLVEYRIYRNNLDARFSSHT